MDWRRNRFEKHSAALLASKGHFRVERCACGVLKLHVGYTSISLNEESARAIQEILGTALERLQEPDPLHSFALRAPYHSDEDLH